MPKKIVILLLAAAAAYFGLPLGFSLWSDSVSVCGSITVTEPAGETETQPETKPETIISSEADAGRAPTASPQQDDIPAEEHAAEEPAAEEPAAEEPAAEEPAAEEPAAEKSVTTSVTDAAAEGATDIPAGGDIPGMEPCETSGDAEAAASEQQSGQA